MDLFYGFLTFLLLFLPFLPILSLIDAGFSLYDEQGKRFVVRTWEWLLDLYMLIFLPGIFISEVWNFHHQLGDWGQSGYPLSVALAVLCYFLSRS